ncbi:MAG: RIP metalloprotease RseP [Planctomycetes bacterium]|nr:RIP metalloprotease RseP [Planctomycetota bacterium]
MLLTIVVFILILSLLVFVHELGHFWVARRFGLKPKEFGFGFPPRVWGIYRSFGGGWKTATGRQEIKDAADTIYSVNLVPLGGFVNLGEDEDGGGDPNHFRNKLPWQRAVILLAGVSMNLILAMFLISLGFMVGLPQVVEEADSRAIISNEQIQVIDVMDDTPARTAGLKMGDVIETIDGRSFGSVGELQSYVAARVGDPLIYVVKRGQETATYTITPQIMAETEEGGIGVGIVLTGLVRYPVYLAVVEGLKTTFIMVWAIIMAFFDLIKGIILGQGVSADLAGPVGIAALTGQVARMGFIYILQFAAILSINLAIINAFPFPALDGGRVLFLMIEKIKGSPVRREIEGLIHNVGFALLMLLVLLVTFRDITRFGDTFKLFWEKVFG